MIPAAAWTTADQLDDIFPDLAPLDALTDSFNITVPCDWAGMVSTTYQFALTVTSLVDEGIPPASNTVVVEHTVKPTMESMTLYISLEVNELNEWLVAAKDAGTKTGGLIPITNATLRRIDTALEYIWGDDLGHAASSLSSARHIMEAFVRALDGSSGEGSKLEEALYSKWRDRALASIDDLGIAEASDIPSQPDCRP